MPQHDDHDDLSALDFSAAGSGSDATSESDPLDFSAADGNGEESGADAFQAFTPTQPEDTGTEMDAIDAQAPVSEDDEEAEDDLQAVTVTNPPETVSVSALMDGRTHQVHLSAKATNMTETELAEEILVIADLARQKGLAGQHTFLMQNEDLSQGMHDIGIDDDSFVRGFFEEFMNLPTEEQAAEAQAEVFATRYTADK